jgi:RecB family exonuclease
VVGKIWLQDMSSDIENELINHANRGTLLHAIFHEYGRLWSDENDPKIEALANLHNQGKSTFSPL